MEPEPKINTFKARNFWVWPGPQRSGDIGEAVLSDGFLHFAVFRIDGFPDLTLNRELGQIDVQQRDLLLNDIQQKFVDSFYKLCQSGNSITGHVGLSWRYILDPTASFEQKIALYLLVRTFSADRTDSQISHIAQLIRYIFPTDHGLYHPPQPVTDDKEVRYLFTAS